MERSTDGRTPRTGVRWEKTSGNERVGGLVSLGDRAADACSSDRKFVVMTRNLLPEPPPTLLPADPDAAAALAGTDDPTSVAARFPAYSAVWATLAEAAFEDGRVVDSYAYARVGYHRGLDALRKSGWKGFGPVPWSHEPNRGFLRSLAALARAAGAIGERDEEDRCRAFLRDCDPRIAERLSD